MAILEISCFINLPPHIIRVVNSGDPVIDGGQIRYCSQREYND